MQNPLDANRIRACLAAQSTLDQLTVLDSVDSTNRWLLEHGQHNSVCVTEEQTAGRGRRGRVWQSPAGQNIYLSLRWHFQRPPPHYSWLSLIVAVTLAEVLQQCGLKGHQIKWPNDVYHQGKKLAGVLLQTDHQLEQVVIGIGLNVNMQADASAALTIEQPWCSLKQITQQDWDRNRLLAQLITALQARLQVFPNWDVVRMQYLWQPWDLLSQCSVSVQEADRTLQGMACGLDQQGRLLVLDANGVMHTLSAAEVSVRL